MRVSIKKQETITEVIEIDFPYWMQCAIKGQKIEAIKALREDAGAWRSIYNPGPDMMSLAHAKNIVEEFMKNVSRKVV